MFERQELVGIDIFLHVKARNIPMLPTKDQDVWR
jgi:hypothetical protein